MKRFWRWLLTLAIMILGVIIGVLIIPDTNEAKPHVVCCGIPLLTILCSAFWSRYIRMREEEEAFDPGMMPLHHAVSFRLVKARYANSKIMSPLLVFFWIIGLLFVYALIIRIDSLVIKWAILLLYSMIAVAIGKHREYLKNYYEMEDDHEWEEWRHEFLTKGILRSLNTYRQLFLFLAFGSIPLSIKLLGIGYSIVPKDSFLYWLLFDFLNPWSGEPPGP